MLHGSCACGAVRFTIAGTLANPVTCHCGQCRKSSGNHVAAGRCPEAELSFETDAGLTWYASSPGAKRGFCGTCGSQLFWKNVSSPNISVHLGSLDGETGLKLEGHIYCAAKADWEEIDGPLPKWEYEDEASDAKPWTAEAPR